VRLLLPVTFVSACFRAFALGLLGLGFLPRPQGSHAHATGRAVHLRDRAYSFQFCSPTRSSLQSGRYPSHVNDKNFDVTAYNPSDPVSGFAAVSSRTR
jgi:hypothetical protein